MTHGLPLCCSDFTLNTTHPLKVERCGGAGKLVMVPSGIAKPVSKSTKMHGLMRFLAPKWPILRFLIRLNDCLLKTCRRITILVTNQKETKRIKWTGTPFLTHSHLALNVQQGWDIDIFAGQLYVPSALVTLVPLLWLAFPLEAFP